MSNDILPQNGELTSHKKTKNQVQDIVSMYQSDSKTTRSMKNITGKMEIIEAMLKWSTECENVEDKYLLLLKPTLESIDVGAVLETLEVLEGWLKYRNEVIHASMNKDIDSLFGYLPEKVEEGMQYARLIDAQTTILRKKSLVRKKMNMGNN